MVLDGGILREGPLAGSEKAYRHLVDVPAKVQVSALGEYVTGIQEQTAGHLSLDVQIELLSILDRQVRVVIMDIFEIEKGWGQRGQGRKHHRTCRWTGL